MNLWPLCTTKCHLGRSLLLLCRAFASPCLILLLTFFSKLVCFSFSYTAAAVITHEEGVDGVPYLDKFTVGRQSQVSYNISQLCFIVIAQDRVAPSIQA